MVRTWKLNSEDIENAVIAWVAAIERDVCGSELEAVVRVSPGDPGDPRDRGPVVTAEVSMKLRTATDRS